MQVLLEAGRAAQRSAIVGPVVPAVLCDTKGNAALTKEKARHSMNDGLFFHS